ARDVPRSNVQTAKVCSGPSRPGRARRRMMGRPAGPEAAVIRYLLVTLIITAIAIAVTAAILGGVDVDGGIGTYLWLAILFGLVNCTIGLVLKIITLPLTLITFGLFALVVNGVLMAITAWLSDKISIDNFGW